jgi:membrane-bound serine protease (ClpP class)
MPAVLGPWSAALLFVALVCVFVPSDARAKGVVADRVEVVAVHGIIDGPVEDSILRTLRVASARPAAVVLQIDSRGVLGEARARRLVEAVLRSDVPVVTWVGPPGAEARNASAVLALAGHIRAASPGSVLGPAEVADLRALRPQLRLVDDLAAALAEAHGLPDPVLREAISAEDAAEAGLVDVRAPQLPDLLRRIDGLSIETSEGRLVGLATDPDEVAARFHKPGLWGRVLHAAAQPSIVYLLLLAGLIGLVFELFHPDTGPVGLAGLVGFALGAYGVAVLGGSWVAVGLIVAGVAAFCVDLRVQGLGVFTLVGFAALVAGSVLLFRAPWLRASPWVIALGVAGMVAFLLGAMTRVLRDLRAVASGELEVQDAHAHLAEEVD